MQVSKRIRRAQDNWQLDFGVSSQCAADVDTLCAAEKAGAWGGCLGLCCKISEVGCMCRCMRVRRGEAARLAVDAAPCGHSAPRCTPQHSRGQRASHHTHRAGSNAAPALPHLPLHSTNPTHESPSASPPSPIPHAQQGQAHARASQHPRPHSPRTHMVPCHIPPRPHPNPARRARLMPALWCSSALWPISSQPRSPANRSSRAPCAWRSGTTPRGRRSRVGALWAL